MHFQEGLYNLNFYILHKGFDAILSQVHRNFKVEQAFLRMLKFCINLPIELNNLT